MNNQNKNLIILTVTILITGMFLIFSGLTLLMYGAAGIGVTSIIFSFALLIVLYNFIMNMKDEL